MKNLVGRPAVLGAVVFVVVAAIGCEATVTSGSDGGTGGASSSSSSSSSSGEAGMGGAGGAGGIGGMGGSGGSGGIGGMLPACGMGQAANYVADKIFLGDTNIDGTPNPISGWKYYGFNLDGRISLKESTDLCQPSSGGTKTQVYPDGNDGIDNSFGKNILPILLALSSDLSTVYNDAIANGEFSYLMSLDVVDQTACSTSSKFFLGGNLGSPAKFDGTDKWPIDSTSLINLMNPTSAKCVFPETRLEMGQVRAWPPSQFDLHLKASGTDLVLPIQLARMTLTLSPDLQGATEVRVGGVIKTADMEQAMTKFMGAVDSSLCDPNSPTLKSIINQMRQASDIMQDGTQDPAKVCDGISIGIGFTMKSVQMGSVVTPPPPMDPCMP